MMRLTSLQSGDIPQLTTLETLCFPDPWQATSWETSFTRADFFGFTLKEGETLVGFVCGTSRFEESELLKIAVHPSSRGKGYGERLFQALESEAKKRGAEKIFLEVRASNVAALGLYRKSGFTQTRIRKNYYPDGETAVEMVKSINKE